MSNEVKTHPPRFQWWYRLVFMFGRIFVFAPVFRLKRVMTERYKGDLPGPCILVYNHVCDHDYMGVVNGFRRYSRYVASDVLIRKRHMRFAMNLVSDFIYRRKGQNGDNVVEAVKSTIAKGVHVCIAPEGGESINGTTTMIRPRTGEMIKEARSGLVIFRMEGGYFAKPAWSPRANKGPLYGRVVSVHSKEELETMTSEEINALIYQGLYLNSYEWQRENRVIYETAARAEHMERALYICPKCNALGDLHSEGHDLFCSSCNYTVTVDEYGFYNGDGLIFDNLYDWDMWQRDFMFSQLDAWVAAPDTPIVSDEGQGLTKVVGNNSYMVGNNVSVTMTYRHLCIEGEGIDIRLQLDEIQSMTAAHREDLGVLIDGEYYQLTSPYERSPYKYIHPFRMIRGKPYR